MIFDLDNCRFRGTHTSEFGLLILLAHASHSLAMTARQCLNLLIDVPRNEVEPIESFH
jgi:hypothetical protein